MKSEQTVAIQQDICHGGRCRAFCQTTNQNLAGNQDCFLEEEASMLRTVEKKVLNQKRRLRKTFQAVEPPWQFGTVVYGRESGLQQLHTDYPSGKVSPACNDAWFYQ